MTKDAVIYADSEEMNGFELKKEELIPKSMVMHYAMVRVPQD